MEARESESVGKKKQKIRVLLSPKSHKKERVLRFEFKMFIFFIFSYWQSTNENIGDFWPECGVEKKHIREQKMAHSRNKMAHNRNQNGTRP